MLFAVDIDHTIATYYGTDALNAYVREAMEIPIAPSWRKEDYPNMMTHDALLLDPAYAAWFKEQGEPLLWVKKMFHEGQYSPILQQRAIPIEGAVETLNRLVEGGNRIVYV